MRRRDVIALLAGAAAGCVAIMVRAAAEQDVSAGYSREYA